jgi:uncharacterized protein
MSCAFGRWDWAINGVLFAIYHLHVQWVIPHALLGMFSLAYVPCRTSFATVDR